MIRPKVVKFGFFVILHFQDKNLLKSAIDIPIDCPTRERTRWTGDSQVFFETASFLTNYARFIYEDVDKVLTSGPHHFEFESKSS